VLRDPHGDVVVLLLPGAPRDGVVLLSASFARDGVLML